MTHPRILAVGTAVPPTRFDQAQLLALAGYDDPQRRGFFLHGGIDGRHLYMDPARPRADEDVDELTARFQEGSVALATRAVRACLEQADVDVGQVDFLATTTCTGRLCPSLDAHLIRALGFREDVQRVHVGDTGCASAIVALQQAHNYLRAFPGHRALVVAAEVCSATYVLDDALETAVANAIFADGAGALLLGTEGLGPAVVGHRTLIRSEHLDRMGFTFPGGRHRVKLSKEIRRIAPAMMEEVAMRLLKDHGLRREDVRFWVLHSAGRRVIERAQTALGLPDADLAFSREVLRRFGNMSSATVLFVLDEVLRTGGPQPGDWGVMVALGPGFAAEGALLHW
ncbi:MAG: type III polyketide synthase [Candidatus Rokubacteria bacterium]|nr:type III polyketide synthase [Candidatus Rokubacteria bacterium]